MVRRHKRGKQELEKAQRKPVSIHNHARRYHFENVTQTKRREDPILIENGSLSHTLLTLSAAWVSMLRIQLRMLLNDDSSVQS